MKYYEYIINILNAFGIKRVFAYPGEQIKPLYDGLCSSDIDLVMARRESGCGHMADGYGRILNYFGVALATAGPGATNLMTPIATAYKDSSSLICITGRCNREYIGKNYFQEIKHDFLNVYKGYLLLGNKEDKFLNGICESIYSRKPVHFNIPSDVLYSNKDNNFENFNIEPGNFKDIKYIRDGLKYLETLNTDVIIDNLKKLRDKKGVLLLGQGIYGLLSYWEMLKLNDILKNSPLPIITTYPVRGAINEYEEISLGLCGRRGTVLGNNALLNSDYIISIGASLSYNTIPKSIRDKVIKKIIPIEKHIYSLEDVRTIIEYLNQIGLKPYDNTNNNSSIKINNIKINKNNNTNNSNNNFNSNSNNNINNNINNFNKTDFNKTNDNQTILNNDYPSKIREILNTFPENGIVITDAGNHTVFTSLLKKCIVPKNIISSHSMGTMGFGLPAGIGVKFACMDYNIDREVMVISGDGGFQMSLEELGVVSDYNLKILIIIMKNNHLNMFGKIKNPDFNKIGDAYNINNEYITKTEEIRNSIKNHLKGNKPTLLVIECDNDKIPKPFL